MGLGCLVVLTGLGCLVVLTGLTGLGGLGGLTGLVGLRGLTGLVGLVGLGGLVGLVGLGGLIMTEPKRTLPPAIQAADEAMAKAIAAAKAKRNAAIATAKAAAQTEYEHQVNEARIAHAQATHHIDPLVRLSNQFLLARRALRRQYLARRMAAYRAGVDCSYARETYLQALADLTTQFTKDMQNGNR